MTGGAFFHGLGSQLGVMITRPRKSAVARERTGVFFSRSLSERKKTGNPNGSISTGIPEKKQKENEKSTSGNVPWGCLTRARR